MTATIMQVSIWLLRKEDFTEIFGTTSSEIITRHDLALEYDAVSS